MIYEKEDLDALMKGPMGLLHACIGTPVTGNPTQYMIEQAFHHHSLPHRYLTFDIPPERFAGTMDGLKALGFNGWNITSPYKVEATGYVDRLSPSAQLIGAINCVFREGSEYVGENTDGKGFLQAVREKTSVKGKRVLVFGSGGAARSIICELALDGAASIDIVNRELRKAEQIVRDLEGEVSTQLLAQPLGTQYVIDDSYDIIVQATSVGLFDESGMIPVSFSGGDHAGSIACDVVFNPVDTRFLEEARTAGYDTLDGLGMLAHQGAIIYTAWTGIEAPLDVMKKSLLESFAV